MSIVKHHRGWEYWLDRGNHRYVAVKFEGDELAANEHAEADTAEEVIRLIDAAEDSALVLADAEEEHSICPACYGEGVLLGALGSVSHHRCRQCGLTY